MKILHRQFLHLAAGAAVLPVLPRTASADTYPSRPARLIVGYAAGGPTDTVARLIAQWLSEQLGQQFFVENRPGGGSNIATEAVVRAAPDGYTLLLVTGTHAINATLYPKLNYNFIRDIVPVAGLVRVPNVMVVNPSVPAKTVLEFIAYAKANPGKINMATAGKGSAPHIYGELFKAMTGVDLVPVAYRGGSQALIDLLAGQVQVMFEPTISTLEYIKTDKLRALAVTTASRLAILPNIPTVSEFVPGYESSSFYGIGAPTKTPTENVEKLNGEISAGLADPKIKNRLTDLGLTPMPMTTAEFAKLIADETEKWGKVIRAAHINVG